jgi:hypothetical protein
VSMAGSYAAIDTRLENLEQERLLINEKNG